MIPMLQPPSLQTVRTSWSEAAGISLRVLRLDLIDPVISGNKWFKLRLNLMQAREQGRSQLLSFGGAYSNHLYALSAAARRFGFKSIGVVRGELIEPLNPVMKFAREQGMHLLPVSRSAYREQGPAMFELLHEQFGDFYVIPEGGSNQAGVLGCKALCDLLPASGEQTTVALACGTGTTLAGLIAGFSERTASRRPRLIGVPVLRGGDYLTGEVSRHLRECGSIDPQNWMLETAFHCGGYARSTPELQESIIRNSTEAGLPLEPVYTGKLFLALEKLVGSGRFLPGEELIAIHTGGIIPGGVENFPT